MDHLTRIRRAHRISKRSEQQRSLHPVARFRAPFRVMLCIGILIRISGAVVHAQVDRTYQGTTSPAIMIRSNYGDSAPPMSSFAAAPVVRSPAAPALHSLQRELIYEGMVSYGNYRIFGAAEKVKLYTAGVEYDRELWNGFLGARVDYVSEILPMVLLSQPARTDFWGDPLTRRRKVVPGAGVTPVGFRLLWRDNRRVMPYFEAKGTVLGFTEKALSPEATYENWSFHLTGGVKARLHGRYDLRLGLVSDLHFSNAFVVRSNPAVDLMNVGFGLVRHLGSSRSAH